MERLTHTEIIAIANQKGGVSKTTTAIHLAAGLANKGFKVLGIDLDAQRNFSYCFNLDTEGLTVYDILTGNAQAAQTTQKRGKGYFIPASKKLSFKGASERLTAQALKAALEPIKKDFDFIIIDTPPTRSDYTLNALAAADKLIITAQPDIFSLQGIEELTETYHAVKSINSKLEIAGILLTRYNGRTVATREYTELFRLIANRLGTTIFNTTIRESVTVKEAQGNRQTLFDYAPKANVTKDYLQFVSEIIER